LTNQTIYAHGKLLLTAEYAVLDGALALAIPTNFGQKFTVNSNLSSKGSINWKSYDSDEQLWLKTTFPKENPKGEEVLLHKMLAFIKDNSPIFNEFDFEIEAHLEFPRNWGLGSSSTLVYFLAKLFNLNPFQLNEMFFKGSGYDIACAGEGKPILFSNKNNQYDFKPVELNYSFSENLYFAYLGKKKNSREAIKHYRNEISSQSFIDEISALTLEFLNASSLKDFQILINQHEKLLAERLKSKPVKDILFNDLEGSVKSLGGWGGDFVMIATEFESQKLKDYLLKKDINVLLPFSEMIFKN
jgi:mevalonate kinase